MRTFGAAGGIAVAALIAGSAAVSRGADAPEREFAALEDRLEASPLPWKEAWAKFAPEYAGLAKRHPGTDAAAGAEVRLLEFLGADPETPAREAESAARADRLLAEYPLSPRLERLVDLEHLFAKERYREVLGKLEDPVRADEVRARVVYRRVLGRYGTATLDPYDPDLAQLLRRYAEVSCRGTTYGAVADAMRPPHPRTTVLPGRPAPEIVGRDVNGKEIRLSSFRGKVVAIHFFGVW